MLTLLALITALLIGSALKVLEHRGQNRVESRPVRNVILPPELKQEDFDWFVWSMQMAGLEPERVVNTCSCGYAAECYVHCNHDLNDGKCTGHAWKPMVVKAQKQEASLISWQDSKSEIQALKAVHRNAKKDIEAMRKRMDARHVKLRELERASKNLEKSILSSYSVPPSVLEPRYDYVLDAYHYSCCNRKITRQTLQDLNYVHDCPVLKEKENSRWSGKFVAVDNCEDCYEVQDFSGWVQTLHSNNCSKASNMLQ